MAEVIGQVREVNGEFEIVNENGEIVQLQAGQELQLGEQVQGVVQEVNGQFQIVDQNGNLVELSSGQTLETIDDNTNTTLNNQINPSVTIDLNNGQEVTVNNQNSLLVDQTVSNAQASNFQETQLDNATLDGLENELSDESNLVAQDSDDSSQEEEEQVQSDDSKARELDRNADIANVIADLREVEFASREVDTNIEDIIPFIEARLSISGDPLVIEGNTAKYTLELTQTASSDVIVTLSYTGVAKDGVDYTAIKEVTIPAGSKTVTFDIKTIDDYIADNNEAYTITIVSTQGGGFDNLIIDGSANTVTTTIEDDSKANTPNNSKDTIEPDLDSVTLKIVALDENGNEVPSNVVKEGNLASYKVVLEDKDGNRIEDAKGSVEVTFSGNTASNNIDFNSNKQIVEINKVFSTATIDDYIADNAETFSVKITDKTYSDANTYENVIHNQTAITTTIEDDSKANTPNIPNDGEEPNHEQVIIKLIALDNNGNAILNNGNYTFANDVKEGMQSKYMVLAFKPNETVFNPNTKLDNQTGSVEIEFSNDSANGVNTQNKNDGSEDYKNTTQNVKLGSVINVDTFDDYVADNNEKFNVLIKDKSYSSSINTGYENVNIDTTPVSTTIQDGINDAIANENNDTVYVKIENNVSTKEGGNLTHKLTLVDKDGNEVTIPAGKVITVDLEYSSTNNVIDSDFKTIIKQVKIEGSSNKSFTNITLDDFTKEGTENYTVTIKKVTDESKYFENVEIHDSKIAIGEITDGLYIENIEDAHVDEDDFNPTVQNSTLQGVERSEDVSIDNNSKTNLGINASNDNNNYTLSFDGTPTFTSDKADFNSTNSSKLTSNGQVIEYVINANTITAYAGAQRTQAAKVFEISLNKNNAGGVDDDYTFKQYKNIDHPLVDTDDNIVLKFGFKVNDGSKSSATNHFEVTINDSLPQKNLSLITTDEDSTKVIILSEESFKDGKITINNGVETQKELIKDDIISIYDKDGNDVIGTLKNNANGTVSFTPVGDYSGETKGFSYKFSDNDGDTVDSSITLKVNPIADAPEVSVDDVTTDDNKEDITEDNNNNDSSKTAVSLDLKFDNIKLSKDQTDKNDTGGASAGDHAERNGYIELKFTNGAAVSGAILSLGPNNLNIDSDNKIVKIVIVDNSGSLDTAYHYTGLAKSGDGIYALTKAQYEDIKILHKEDNDTDINITVSTISYEVKDDGTPIDVNDEKLYEKAEDTMSVKIAPKTDPISLIWDNANNLGTISNSNKTFTVTNITEGTDNRKINLKALLSNTSGYKDTNGSQNDLDGSEKREYEISGVPEGTIVRLNGQTATAGKDGIAKIVFNDANNKELDPDFSLELPQYFGGNITSAKIKLSVYDKGADPSDSEDVIKSDEVNFNINVTPVSNKATISVEQSSGHEDAGRVNGNTNVKNGTITNPENGIPLDVKITSDDDDGSETFIVTLDEIPNGVSLYNYDKSKNLYTLVNENTSSSSNIEISKDTNTWKVKIKDYQNDKPVKLIPIHNDDSNITLKVEGSTKDGGAPESEITDPIDLRVVVNPIADVPILNELKTINKDGIDSNDGKDIYSAVLEEQSSGSKIDLESIFKTTNPIKSYDDDGSESIGIVLTNLDSKFNVSGDGIRYVGGEGSNRKWVVDKDKIDKVDITTEKNYSGEVDFSLKYTTIEKNGSSKTHDDLQQNVKVLVKPKAPTSDEHINKETTVLEDTLTKVNFDIKNNDDNEKIDFIWIKKSDVDSKDFSLFLGNSTNTLISTLRPDNIGGTDYYKLDSNQLNNLYVLYKSDLGSSAHTGFDFKYQVSDTLSNLSANQNPIVHTSTINSSYKLNLKPITDGISITASAQDNDVIDIVNEKVNITKEGTFKVNINIDSLKFDNNDKDIDGSETVNHLTFQNVPVGVEVVGATLSTTPLGETFWLLNINPNMDLKDNNSYKVTFKVNGKLSEGVGHLDTVKITAYNKDGDLSELKNASTSIDFVDNIPGGDLLPIETNLTIKDYQVLEDKTFTLADILDFKADSNDGQGNNSTTGAVYSVVIKKLEKLKLDTSNVSKFTEDGKEFYIISGTKDEIQSKLSQVKLTPEDNFNQNNDNGELLKIDVSLTSYVPNTSIKSTAEFSYSDENVTPVTDKIQTTAKAVLDESTGIYDIDISFSSVDNPDFKFVQSESSSSEVSTIKFLYKNGLDGVLSWDGGSSSLSSSNTSVEVPFNKLNTLKFKPSNDIEGTINLAYEVFSKEKDASNIEKTEGLVDIKTKPVADGLDLGKILAKGIETPNEQKIYRTEIKAENGTKSFDEITKLDLDETIESIVIQGVPDTFKIFVQDENGSPTLAQIIGKDDGADTFSWNLNLKNGLPTKVWVDAPDYYSGNIDIKLVTYVKDGKEILRTESPISVEIAPVASNIIINPTKTFGDEYAWIDINLNAKMYDTDGSETLSITLKAKDSSKALDDTMIFRYENGDIINNAVFDESTNTWTISGISHDKIKDLQLKYHDFNGEIDVSASTIEEKGSSNSVKVEDKFSLEIASKNNIQAGDEDNKILYASNKTIDAQNGEDTLILDNGINLDFDNISNLSNFEKIDLNKNANHSLNNLEINDIINMTDSNNSLEILGDSGDSVNLKNSNTETWIKTGTNDGFDIYSKSGDTDLVTLKIDTDIDTKII